MAQIYNLLLICVLMQCTNDELSFDILQDMFQEFFIFRHFRQVEF